MTQSLQTKNYIFSLIAFFLILSGCSGGTTVGNPLVSLKLKSFAPLSLNKNFSSSMTSASINPLEVVNPLAVLRLDLCFKRLRFKPTTDSTNSWTEDNIDFNPGNISFTGAELNLGSVPLPEGLYDRVEFDLDDRCSTGSSVEVQNTAGTFSTASGMSIKFDGVFSHQSDSVLSLNLFSLIAAADTVTADNDIKDALESVEGSLQKE